MVSSITSTLFPFFSHHTPTTEIYTLSLHDALPISPSSASAIPGPSSRPATRTSAKSPSSPSAVCGKPAASHTPRLAKDRKSTRLNSSHTVISYAVFCLKKKKQNKKNHYVLRQQRET